MKLAFIVVMLLVVGGRVSAQSGPVAAHAKDVVPKDSPGEDRRTDKKAAEKKADSESSWKWIIVIALTAVISPLTVKWVEKKLTSDPIRDQAGRLKSLIEVAALQKAHGLPEDSRIRGLIDEQTDRLAGHSKGRQEALDETISMLIADLSVRLCEALFSSCHQLELLADSKHRSNTLLAVLDLTRLEFLRSAHSIECLQIPPHFKSVSKADFDKYVQHLGESESPVGTIAAQNATELGTTPDAIEAFVRQIQETIKRPSVDTRAARILRRQKNE